jgi:hypothetical protein
VQGVCAGWMRSTLGLSAHHPAACRSPGPAGARAAYGADGPAAGGEGAAAAGARVAVEVAGAAGGGAEAPAGAGGATCWGRAGGQGGGRGSIGGAAGLSRSCGDAEGRGAALGRAPTALCSAASCADSVLHEHGVRRLAGHRPVAWRDGPAACPTPAAAAPAGRLGSGRNPRRPLGPGSCSEGWGLRCCSGPQAGFDVAKRQAELQVGAQEEAAIRDMIVLGERVHALRGSGVEHTPAPGLQQQQQQQQQQGAGHTTASFAAASGGLQRPGAAGAAGLAGAPSGSLSKAPSLSTMLADALGPAGRAAPPAAAAGGPWLGSFGSVMAAALAPLQEPAAAAAAAAGGWGSAGLAPVTEVAEEGGPGDEEEEEEEGGQEQEGVGGSRRSTGGPGQQRCWAGAGGTVAATRRCWRSSMARMQPPDRVAACLCRCLPARQQGRQQACQRATCRPRLRSLPARQHLPAWVGPAAGQRGQLKDRQQARQPGAGRRAGRQPGRGQHGRAQRQRQRGALPGGQRRQLWRRQQARQQGGLAAGPGAGRQRSSSRGGPPGGRWVWRSSPSSGSSSSVCRALELAAPPLLLQPPRPGVRQPADARGD